MAAPFIATPTEGSFQTGFDKQLETNRTRRLANVEAMRKFGEDAALAGRQVGVDEWAQQAQSILGFGDFLNSTAPSADALAVLQRTQNEKAKIKAEELRRAQFASDVSEVNMIEQEVAKQAASGKTEGEIGAWGMQTFGDKFARVAPRLNNIINAASVDLRLRGHKLAETLQFEDDAKEFVASNPSLTQWEKDAIIQRARQNEAMLAQQVVMAGDKVGSSLGYTGDDAAMRQYIDGAIPLNVTGPKRELMLQRGLEAAKRSAQVAMMAAQQKIGLEAQGADAKSVLPRAQTLIQMEEADNQQRAKAAEAMAQQLGARPQTQAGILRQWQDVKKLPKADQEIAPAFSAILSTYVIDDPDELLQALREGKTETVQRIKARAVPIAAWESRSKVLGGIITGATKISNGAEAYQTMGRLVTDASPELTASGKAMADLEKIVTGPYGVTSERRQAARENATIIRRKFVEDAVAAVAQIQAALKANGTVGITADEVDKRNYELVTSMADRFLAAADLPSAEKVDLRMRLVAAVMQGIGPGQEIVRRATPAERLESATNKIMDSRRLPAATGRLPGYLPGPAPGAASNQWWR